MPPPDIAAILALEGAGLKLQEGPLNRTVRVACGDSAYVVRRRIMAEGPYSQTFAGERFAYPLLDEDVRVPALIWCDASAPERRVAVFEYVPNRPCDWRSNHMIQQLAEVLARMHAVPSAVYGSVGAPRTIRSLSDQLKNEFERELQGVASRGSEFAEVALSASAALSGFDLFAESRTVLCHGDLHGGNLLAGLDERLWLIDWEAAKFRPAESDFCKTDVDWLEQEMEDRLFAAYCRLTQRAEDQFRARVDLLRLIHHARAINFKMGWLGSHGKSCKRHVATLRRLAQGLLQ